MALNQQVSSSFSDHIPAYLESRFLDRLEKELHLAKMGKAKTLPQHQGQTVKWNRFTNFAASVTPLTEGTSPSGQNLSSSAVTATLYGYGNFVSVADFFQMTAVNDTLKDATDLLAYQAALTLDSLIRNELDANGTQLYADGTFVGGTNASKNDVTVGTDKIRSTELRGVMKELRKNDVPTFMDGNFRGVIHPLMEFDLISESGTNDFIVLSANNTNAMIEKGEIGVAYGIKLLRSSNIRADVTETAVYGNIFMGRDAFGTVDLASAGLKMIVKPFGTVGEDPLNQRATVGYKFYYATKVLEAARCQVVWAYNAG